MIVNTNVKLISPRRSRIGDDSIPLILIFYETVESALREGVYVRTDG